jgi:hypothetical protein
MEVTIITNDLIFLKVNFLDQESGVQELQEFRSQELQKASGGAVRA